MHIKTAYCGFTTNVVVSGLVIAFAASGWVFGQDSPAPVAPPAYKAEEPANRSLDATLYMQTAAEYRASCYQAYNLAAARLDELIKGGAGKFAVVMDLDETVLDNSRFQAMLLKNGLAWDKDLWKLWEKDHSGDVTLIPGAKKFIEKATHSTGVEVFFVSNRNGKDFKQQALDALTRLGIVTDADHLKLVPDPEAKDSSNKTKRFQEIKDKCSCEVLLYVGDNLRDFDNDLRFKLPEKPSAEDLDRAIAERKDAVDKARGNFGQHWVILPNPTYGEWKAPLGRGQSDFDRLTAAVFPFPTPAAFPTPSASPPCGPHKKCISSKGCTHNVDPAIVAAFIAFLSPFAVFFWRKMSERRSINRAILAEIRRILTVVRRHHDWWAEQIKKEDTNHSLIPFSHAVYSKQVANIGALKNRVVVRAVTFYGYVGFLNSFQAVRPEYIDVGKGAEFDKMYLDALTSFLAHHEHAFDQDFEGIE